MPTARMRRVNEAVKEIVSTSVAAGLKDPRVGFVTITSVDTSQDLRHSRVFVSILGDAASRDEALAGLASSRGFLQAELASQLTLKRTPTLEFVYDESIDRGMRITELLQTEAPEEGLSIATGLDQVVEELRHADRLLLITHENPDGDALGSLLAMHEMLVALGKDSLTFMPERGFALPHEYRDMQFDRRVDAPPEDLSERLVVFLDCGNIDRMPVDFVQREGVRIVNIDHHHDNTRFGSVNLVMAGASSTAEIVFLLSKELGVELTPRIAEALYVGVVTDTGRFMYESTTPEAHRMAAELIEAGVDVHGIYRRIYEELPFRRLALQARALARVERHERGLLTLTHVMREDFEATGSNDSDSEGVIDRIRVVENTAVAALVRDLTCTESGPQRRKVSLRSTDGRVDVSRMARNYGGGGHPQAAGFTTDRDLPSLVEGLRADIREQLPE